MTLCITAPGDNATLTGTTDVTLEVTQDSNSPGIRRAYFTLNGSRLITDFTSPYTFTLDTARFGDGTYELGATTLMRDNWESAAANITLTFANGYQTPPPNPNQFVPTQGTTPAPGSPFVVAATGDGAGGEPGEIGTVGLIGTWNPNLFLYLGDVYEDGLPTEFDNWYGPDGTAGMYGKFRSITNPVIGNHEYTGNDASGYFYYWDNIPDYYSYDASGWHFIALNSTSQFGQTATNSGQYKWLMADLAANASPCTVVYYHHPLLNTGPEGSTASMSAIWSLLAQHNVTLVLNGHDHNYQRFEPVDGNLNPDPNGITEIIVGSGGHGHQEQVVTDSRLVAADFANFGALRLNLFPTSATFSFQTPTGSVEDSGLLSCKGTADSIAPEAPGSVSAAANGPGEIDVTWNAATDNVGVAGYEVFKDDATTPLVTLDPDTLAYADTVVAPGSNHSYTVEAFDAAGNRSPPGGPASATTPSGTVTLVLTPIADAYVNPSIPTTNRGTATSLYVNSSGTASYLKFDLSNVVGQIQSATLGVLSNTTTGSQGFGVAGVADTTWDEYAIVYDTAPDMGAVVNSSGPLTSGVYGSADVDSLVAPAQGGLLSLGLTGYAGTINLASRETTTPPTLTIVVGTGATDAPAASFTSSTTSPTVGVPVQFTDTSSGSPTAWAWDFGDGSTSTQANPSHAWAAAGPYTVSLVASNLYGDSTPATTTITVGGDSQAPTAPGSVTATVNGSSIIDVSWSASTDDVGVTGYDVYRDSDTTPVATVDGATLAFTDTGLAPGSTHSYTVDAFDAAGNHSPLSDPSNQVTTDASQTFVLNPIQDSYVSSDSPTSNYGTSTGLRIKGSGQSTWYSYMAFDLSNVAGAVQSATLTLTYQCSKNAGIGYTVYDTDGSAWDEGTITYASRPAVGAAVDTTATHCGPGVVTSTDVASLVAAAEGNVLTVAQGTGGSQEVFASRETTTPPTLTIVVGTGATDAPAASFTSSTTSPTVGVPVQFTDTSSGSPTAWAWDFGDGSTSTQANPSHAWAAAGPYTVSLVASNLYGDSTPATTTITVGGDSQAPTAPGSVTATVNGSSIIDVSWSASTDDVGVTGYDVYRDSDTTPVATVDGATLAFTDTGLAPGSTHSYTVDAFDAAGNHSPLSDPSNQVTTDASQTFVLNPIQDSYVSSDSPTSNYGTSTGLRIKGSGQSTWYSYMAFDLSNVAGAVQSATLTLTYQCSKNAGIGYTVYDTDGSAWDEGTITYASRPAVGAAVDTTATHCGPGVVTSTDVASLVAAAEGNVLTVAQGTGGSQEVFASRETTTPPTLTIVVGQ